jgi:hypothetical protein
MGREGNEGRGPEGKKEKRKEKEVRGGGALELSLRILMRQTMR